MTGSITMNGVKLEDIMRKNKGQEDENSKKTTVRKTSGRKKTQKTMPSSGSNKNTITKYIRRNIPEDRNYENNNTTEDNLSKKVEVKEPANLFTRREQEEDRRGTIDNDTKKLTNCVL